MSKTVVVISSLVDSTIREGQIDTNFILFKTIDELDAYVEKTPVRADYLYFTRETIPHVNTSLNYLASMLINPFLKVDKVCYITEANSSEIASVKYIAAEKEFTNWEIVEGHLTREYINGIITGSLRTDGFNKKRKAVYRVPRAAYVQDRIKNKEALEEEYLDDEKLLADVPPVDVPEDIVSNATSSCRMVHIVGADIEERTVLSFLVAQYLAFSGKTLIVEKDVQYHLLSDYVAKSGVACLSIDINELLENPLRTFDKIKRSEHKLICVTAFKRTEYSYAFITSLIYCNLFAELDYMIMEDTFGEAPTTEKYTVALPSTVIGTLRTCEQIDMSHLHLINFVGVNLRALPQMSIVNGKILATLLTDVLETPVENTVILNVHTLKIGGENGYDLRSIIGER